MVENGTLLQNRYLIDDCIGKGGMGAVYVATDQKFGSRVAIKETFYEDNELAEAFAREARLLNALHHPVLPHVSDYFHDGKGYFLVMEYIEGEDLSEVLRRQGSFPVSDVVRWTLELLDGLDYLHSQEPPVVHRDIKPHNLKLTSRSNIVLLDFGLAKETSGNTLGGRSVFGYSRRYSPLEQIEGVGTDPRSDLFSLGATVFHLITGKQPIDVVARASAIVAGKPDPLQFASDLNPEVPAAVTNVIWTSMALNADLRFATANAMKTALEDAVQLGEESRAVTPLGVPLAATVEDVPPSFENSFPALEAFIEETEEVSNAHASEAYRTPEAPDANISEPYQASEVLHADLSEPYESPLVSDESRDIVKIPVLPRPANYEWMRPAMAALAAIVIIALAYVMIRSASSDDPAQSESQGQDNVQNIQQESATETEALPVAADKLHVPQQPVEGPSEAKSETKKSAGKQKETKVAQKTTEKPDSIEPVREVEDERPVVVRRKQNQNLRQIQRRERVARQPEFREPPVVTIETIFTGIPYGRRNRRQSPY